MLNFADEAGVGLVVAQHRREIVADVDCDLLHVVRLDRRAVHQVQHAVDGAMRAVAGGILLDAEALRQDGPVLTGMRFAVAILGAAGRDRMQEALRMFERVHAGGEAGLGEARRHDAGVSGFAGVERLGHGAEIRHQAGTLRGAERDRLRGLFGVQTAQAGAGRRGADGTVEAGGVPALLVQQAAVATEQLRPGFVAGDVGDDHVGARGVQGFGLGQDGGDQHGAGMAAQADVVVVERVGGGAVDPGGLGGGALLCAEGEGGGAVGGRQHLLHDAHAILAAAGDHGADAVDEAEARDADGVLRQAVRREVGDELAERLCQRHGVSFPVAGQGAASSGSRGGSIGRCAGRHRATCLTVRERGPRRCRASHVLGCNLRSRAGVIPRYFPVEGWPSG